MKKHILVTGATGDIGQAICLQLATADKHIIIHTNKNQNKARELLKLIEAKGASAEIVVFNVADSEQTQKVLADFVDEKTIQILVNNAGIHDDAPLAGMSLDAWHNVIDVSLNGFFHVTQPLLLPMIRTRFGRIINIASISALIGNRGQANYAAAKAGLIGATKSLAKEVASRGITVNAIAPGIISGAMTDKLFDAEKIKQWVPMQRSGKPEEVAALVAFLASEQAAYISGQTIAIDGAMV